MAEVVQHPVLPIPRVRDFYRPDWTEKDVFERWQASHRRRNELIAQEAADPLRYGYEPGKWKLVDALMDQPCRDISFVNKIRQRFDLSYPEWCAKVREFLGFGQIVKIMLIAGTNRSSKTEFAGKRVNQNMTEIEDFQVWCYAETSNNSIRIQQPVLFKYLSPEFKTKIKTDAEYVNYSKQRGFVESHFILPGTLSECDLRNYSQDVKTAEGGDLDVCWADELIPPSFMNTLPARIASRGGIMWITFTPVDGYTPVVAEFQNSAEIVLEVPAYLLPIDGGEPDVPRALGFNSAAEMEDAAKDGIKCIPWDILEWFEWMELGEKLETGNLKLEMRETPDGRMVGPGSPLPPEGRHFRMVPVVKRCRDNERGVVYYHPMDNPYANPQELWNRYKNKSKSEILIRMYGEATRMQANQIPRFERSLHVIPDEKIPKTGTVYQILDPTPGGRPYVWGYFRVTRHGSYLYREFPRVDLSADEIDLNDFPSGEWAVVSERKAGVNDGDPGPGCQPIGWGLRRYKRQFALEEGWRDAVGDGARTEDGGQRTEGTRNQAPSTSDKQVDDWDEANGAREVVSGRFIDPAAAEMPRQSEDEATTLTEQFDDLGIYFEHALRGKNTADRIRAINDMFDYDKNADGEVVRYPKLRVAESCKNTIYCVENYLGVDGQKGVMKDFIDILGYFAMLDLEYIEAGSWKSSGGGHM